MQILQHVVLVFHVTSLISLVQNDDSRQQKVQISRLILINGWETGLSDCEEVQASMHENPVLAKFRSEYKLIL